MTIPTLMMFDNFYGNPMDVRNYALSLPFDVVGNYPGRRTKPVPEPWNSEAKAMFEKILSKKITWWPEEYTTSFQYTTKDDDTWIHYDPTMWAAVIYLTPDAPLEAGTAIYQNKKSKVYMLNRNDPNTDYNNEAQTINNMDDWEPIVRISNIFNRMIMYRGEYYHRSMLPGFGDNQYNGRLFQTFFFNTEN